MVGKQYKKPLVIKQKSEKNKNLCLYNQTFWHTWATPGKSNSPLRRARMAAGHPSRLPGGIQSGKEICTKPAWEDILNLLPAASAWACWASVGNSLFVSIWTHALLNTRTDGPSAMNTSGARPEVEAFTPAVSIPTAERLSPTTERLGALGSRKLQRLKQVLSCVLHLKQSSWKNTA